MSQTLHSAVTDTVIARIRANIESGIPAAPWQKPWIDGVCVGPKSGSTGKDYRGINWFLLQFAGYANPYWFTFNKARSLKGSVKKGEKGTLVVFWNFVEKKDVDGTKRKVAFLRYYKVFNALQCEGLPDKFYPVPSATRELESMGGAEAIVHAFDGPTIKAGTKACYCPGSDEVLMPERSTFKTCGHYFSVLFHELIHSTGHESRLDRDIKNGFGGEKYALEELVAEMGAAMLCAHAGIEGVFDNSIAYLQAWLEKLQSNPDWLIKAAGKAQKAVDCILGRSWGDDEGGECEDSGEG